jgi:hypothetical protein
MSEGIVIALITGGFMLVSNLITNLFGSKKTTNEIRQDLSTYQAVTNEKISELTREVREHNDFAKRMPLVEKGLENIEEKVNYFHKV